MLLRIGGDFRIGKALPTAFDCHGEIIDGTEEEVDE
jgi:hypothetical protein